MPVLMDAQLQSDRTNAGEVSSLSKPSFLPLCPDPNAG